MCEASDGIYFSRCIRVNKLYGLTSFLHRSSTWFRLFLRRRSAAPGISWTIAHPCTNPDGRGLPSVNRHWKLPDVDVHTAHLNYRPRESSPGPVDREADDLPTPMSHLQRTGSETSGCSSRKQEANSWIWLKRGSQLWWLFYYFLLSVQSAFCVYGYDPFAYSAVCTITVSALLQYLLKQS